MRREEDGGRLACRAASERIGSSAGKASKVRTDLAPQSDEQSVSFANTVSKAGLNDFVQLDTLLNDPSSVCGFQGASLESTFLDSSMVEHPAVNRVVAGSSPARGALRPHGQAVKTSPFHGGNSGSIPDGVTFL